MHDHATAERHIIHVLWLTSGLGCDGDSVSMTAARNPSLEDLLHCVLPGMPRLAIYNSLLAYETGEQFVEAFWRAARGMRRLRVRTIRQRFDIEPDWRRPSEKLESGYKPRW
jgi:Ni,Fe-hydrogenase I small subunit